MKDNYKINKDIESILLYGRENERKEKLISIVIPTYKREKLLKEALESAVNQLNFSNYEIVIVDNDENFDNLEIKKMVENYQKSNIYYYKNEKNLGMTGNWNRCIELANSEWIVMLHDDDWLKEDALYKVNEIIQRYRNIDLINFKYITYFEKENRYEYPKGRNKIEKVLLDRFFLGKQVIAPIGIILKKKKVLDIGGFDSDFYPSLDLEFWCRFIQKYIGITITNNPIAFYRIGVNESLNIESQKNFLLKDYQIMNYLEKKYKVTYKISKYNHIYNIYYKSKSFKNFEEKKKFLDKLSVKKYHLINAIIIRKLQIVNVARLYLRLKTYFFSLKYR